MISAEGTVSIDPTVTFEDGADIAVVDPAGTDVGVRVAAGDDKTSEVRDDIATTGVVIVVVIDLTCRYLERRCRSQRR